MNLTIEPYLDQQQRWPTSGRHILAQFDDDSVVVYQAYRPSIGRFAATHGYFGGEWSFNRMSWIKPHFLWMMYRSGWGQKPDQETTLAIRLTRSGFDTLLDQAVHSSFVPHLYGSQAEWSRRVATPAVRLQWDLQHGHVMFLTACTARSARNPSCPPHSSCELRVPALLPGLLGAGWS